MECVSVTTLPYRGQTFFGARVAREGHIVPPFENHVPLVLTPYCLVFLKACPKLNHMTHFGFHGNHLSVLMWLKGIFSTKTSNQRHCTNGNSFGI